MKNLKNLGQALSKAEQKLVTGGKLDANPPPPYVVCYNVTYGYWGTDQFDNPTLILTQTYQSGAQAVSFSAIIPTPTGC